MKSCMINLEWEKKQFEKWLLSRDGAKSIEWVAAIPSQTNYVPERIYLTTIDENEEEFEWEFDDEWRGWLARAELDAGITKKVNKAAVEMADKHSLYGCGLKSKVEEQSVLAKFTPEQQYGKPRFPCSRHGVAHKKLNPYKSCGGINLPDIKNETLARKTAKMICDQLSYLPNKPSRECALILEPGIKKDWSGWKKLKALIPKLNNPNGGGVQGKLPPKNADLIVPNPNNELYIICGKCGVGRKLHKGVKHKCPKK